MTYNLETEKLFSEALDYFEQKNYAKAIYIFTELAEMGLPKAMYYLGICYYHGYGTGTNLETAAHWYEKAANLGHAKAQFNIAMCYIHGRGVNQNEPKAVDWLAKATEQGDVQAICNLANCYFHAIGVAQDYEKAIEYYQKAAEQGDAFAQYNLGNAYSQGLGVPKDIDKAKEWLQKSIAGGTAEAQKLLDKISGNAPAYKMTFNYLFSHRTLPMSIFHDLDMFYQSIITSPQNLQRYLQNVLLTATAWAQKYSPDVEPGFTVERFKMGIFGQSYEYGVIAINIPNCAELNDCVDIAIPCRRDHAGYFTCELSENTNDGSMMFIVGEWKPDGNSENLTHVNYGPLKTETKETFIARVIKIVYGVDYVPPVKDDDNPPASENDESDFYTKFSTLVVKGYEAYKNKDYTTALNLLNETLEEIDIYAVFFQIRSQVLKALGNFLMSDYDMFRAKLIDYYDIMDGKTIDTEIIKTLELEPREPLIQTENYYDILQNNDEDLLFCIREREGEPRNSEILYSGGKNALLCRRLGQYVLLDEVHQGVRNKLYEIEKVLIAEFKPTDEKRNIDKDSGIIREYMATVRHLSPTVNLDTIEDICIDIFPMTIYLATLICSNCSDADTALKYLKTIGDKYPENYYALYEIYAGFPDIENPSPDLTKWLNREKALYYLELSAKYGYEPAIKIMAEYAPPPDCADLKEIKMTKTKELLKILEDDMSAWLLRPATQKEITQCQKDLESIALEPLPKSYIAFLKIHNGFAWNGIEFYGTYKVSEEGKPDGFKLIDIVSMNDEFNDLYELDDKVLLGRADEDYYTYNIETEKYEALELESRETWEEFDTFDELFASVVGGRLSSVDEDSLTDEDINELQYEHDEGRYDGEV